MVRALLLAGLLGVGAGLGWIVLGGVGRADPPHGSESTAEVKSDRPVKDPVEDAFELPRGVVLLGNQIKAYGEFRKQLEPPLRSALGRVESATDEQEKLQAVAEVKRIRESIRLGIQEILRLPPSDPKAAPKKAQDNKGHKAPKKPAHAKRPDHKPDPPKKPAAKKPNRPKKDADKKPNTPKKQADKKPNPPKKDAGKKPNPPARQK